MDDFKYAALGPESNAIRLLTVKGRDTYGFLDISIRNATTHEADYVALSYIWGTESATCVIKLNDARFRVRTNLYTFITTNEENIKGKDLWIDAVCIDQNDIEDKNRQVTLMGEIFSSASRVISWLERPLEPVTTRTFEVVRHFVHTFEDGTVAFDVEKVDLELMAGILTRLVSHPYWSRLWIVQEVLLANKLEIQFEGHKMSPNVLMKLIDFMIGNLKIAKLLHEIDDRVLQQAERLRSFLSTKAATATLFNLVCRYIGQESAIAQDHIFALRSLATDGLSFQIDYAEVPGSLFTRLLSTLPDFKLGDVNRAANVAGSLNVTQEIQQYPLLRIDPDSTGAPRGHSWKYVLGSGSPPEFTLCQSCFSTERGKAAAFIIAGVSSAGLYFVLRENLNAWAWELICTLRPDFDVTMGVPVTVHGRDVTWRKSADTGALSPVAFGLRTDAKPPRMVFHGDFWEHLRFIMLSVSQDANHAVNQQIDDVCLAVEGAKSLHSDTGHGLS